MKLIATSIVALAALSMPASALTLEQAREAGVVCERQDGLLQAIDDSAEGLVAAINARRMDAYSAIAKENGVDIAVVRASAAKKLSEKAKPCGVKAAEGQ